MKKGEVQFIDRGFAFICLSAESAELRISTLTDLGRHRGFHEQLALAP